MSKLLQLDLGGGWRAVRETTTPSAGWFFAAGAARQREPRASGERFVDFARGQRFSHQPRRIRRLRRRFKRVQGGRAGRQVEDADVAQPRPRRPAPALGPGQRAPAGQAVQVQGGEFGGGGEGAQEDGGERRVRRRR
jgi:hypothetical protein